jgi:hypothetical protein
MGKWWLLSLAIRHFRGLVQTLNRSRAQSFTIQTNLSQNLTPYSFDSWQRKL